mgnify:CR=1 FL=1
MSKVKTFKTNVSIQKSEKETLKRDNNANQHLTKIYKFYNRITTRVQINNGRFRVVWRSQCNVDQKRERRERPVNIAADIHVYAERFGGYKKNSLLFALHI